MLRVAFVPNAFKESLSAVEAARVMSEAVRKNPHLRSAVTTTTFIMADGGDGFLESLAAAASDKVQWMTATDPVRSPLPARSLEGVEYLVSADGSTVYVEMARASGLHLLRSGEKDGAHTTTYGTGQVISQAVARASTLRRIVVGLGGSATNDGGAGLAQALGYKFLHHDTGKEITAPMTCDLLLSVGKIVPPTHPVIPASVDVVVACDVQNPLVGPNGATAVYGPQKGIVDVQKYDGALAHLHRLWVRDLGVPDSLASMPGGGAAGGLGAGLLVWAKPATARLRPGFDIFAEQSGLFHALQSGDIDAIITTEGRLDTQSLEGKGPIALARLAQQAPRASVPTIGIFGKIDDDVSASLLLDNGLTAAFALANGPITAEESMRDCAKYLQKQTEMVLQLLVAGRNMAAMHRK